MAAFRALMKWVFFSVALALAPIGASWLIASTRGGLDTLEGSLKHGELLLITVALCAAAVGDLIGTSREIPIRKIIAGGGAMVILVTSAIYFAGISADISVNAVINPAQLTTYSIYLFISGVICSGLCVGLAAEADIS